MSIIGDILHSRVARSNLWGLTEDGRGSQILRAAEHEGAGD